MALESPPPETPDRCRLGRQLRLPLPDTGELEQHSREARTGAVRWRSVARAATDQTLLLSPPRMPEDKAEFDHDVA
jgi:hypothetical protein